MNGVKKLACGVVLSVAVAFGAANAWADPATSYVSVGSGDATIVDLGDQFAVVFSNAQASATLTSLRDCYLMRSLVVGGGGGGGRTMGGGGGGGQVLERSALVAFSANDEFTVTVGAGGEWTAPTGYRAGAQGGTSTLVYPDGTTINAYGGGGGGGFSETEPTASANGLIGSGGGNAYNRATAPTKGTHYNYGNPGGLAQGGGGGAGAAGENPGLHAESVLYDNETSYRTQAGYGGEGVTNDISGVDEVYGSGGGGGGGQNYWSQFHAPGGTHAGAGATRTDKTGGGDGNNNALPAEDGFGAGGGGGGFSQTGGTSSGGDATRGGCGTVILRFTKVDMSALVFEVAPITEDFYYTGSAIEPVPVVTHVKDGSTVDPTEYDVVYSDNIQPGTATIHVVGKGGHAGVDAVATFTIRNMVADAYIAASDFTMRSLTVAGRHVYIFTNTAAAITLTARQDLTLVDALVVGGGGGGGNSVGGAGGGGGVTQLGGSRMLFSGESLTINVGAGGSNNDGAASFRSGTQGGTSVVVFPDTSSLVAYGGGGGGGYQKSPTAVTDGHIASGGGAGGGGTYSSGTDGYNYNSTYGHVGGATTYNLGAGGGGAGTAASGGNGGEGVENDITGVNVVYGSGGGGGARNSGTPGTGGTNAGGGTNGNATAPAPNGVDGTGSGGGGGGYQGNKNGGYGGCGTIILAFEEGVTIGQPTVESLTVAYLGDTTQPRVSAVFGNSKPGGTYSATVKMSFYLGDGTLLETNMYYGVAEGDAIEWNVPVCVQPGAEVYATVLVTSAGAVDVNRREDSTATGSISPYYGRGGGTGVIHVRPGATGRGDGSDWFHAYTDLRVAIDNISSMRQEVWFAGDEDEAVVPTTISPAVPIVIRGGFAGTEDSAAARVPGALSTIDKNGGYDCLSFDNAQAVTLDGFLLKRGKEHDLVKSGAGDIVVTNCTITGISSGNGPGRGAHITGTASTTARLEDVRFVNILGSGTAGTDNGTALFAQTMRRVIIDDCLFSTNGCPFYATGNELHNMNGACIYADGAPLTVRRTRFAGNRSQALTYGNVSRGGVVRILGNCGVTAFTNCVFVGNEVVHGYSNYSEFKSYKAGMLAASPSAGMVDVVGCTFAMGLAEVSSGAAGVSVIGGTANISDCIFYGNTNGTANTAGSDIQVFSGATAHVAYCLFEDDSAGRIVCDDGGTLDSSASTFVYGDPLFVADSKIGAFVRTHGIGIDLDSGKLADLAAFNVHLRGGLGYFDEATRALVKDYARGEKSPGIDKGNPNSDYRKEPAGYNGRRVNLGYYGNTPWATMTQPVGSVYYLR